MENGRGASHGDRRKRGDRRRTLSGAIPSVQNEVKSRLRASSDVMRLPWSSPSAPTSPAIPVQPTTTTAAQKSSGHRRALSGTIFSKLNFLRGSGDDGREPRSLSREKDRSPTKSTFNQKSVEDDAPPTSPKAEQEGHGSGEGLKSKSIFSRKSIDDDAPPVSPTSPEGAKERESALNAAMRQIKTRKRKGSLRKTALLGGRRISLLPRPTSMKQVEEASLQEHEAIVDDLQERYEEDAPASFTREQSAPTIPLSTRRNFGYENTIASRSSDGSMAEPPAATMARLSLLTDHQNQTSTVGIRTMVNELGSPTEVNKSPTSATSYTSTTTDDDDLLTFTRPIKTYPSQTNLTPLSTSTGSYFPPQHTLSRLTSAQRTSPLSRTLPLSAYPDSKSKSKQSEPHSYTETEYWGWIILILTWVTFTVAMGSCLDIWSWAWDVGETPYAPPELENDETLPIVGYYPALIVLTGGVVSWVWITVAWVGMKYFRHAKIEL